MKLSIEQIEKIYRQLQDYNIILLDGDSKFLSPEIVSYEYFEEKLMDVKL